MHCRDFTRQLVAAIVKGIQCLCLRYLLVVLLAASLPRCQGKGMFQVQFLDYANPNQTDAQNRCCNRDADSQGNCRSPCRTFFTVCLQPQSSNRCIYGQASSGVLGSESFVIPSNSLLQGQVTSWPVSFEMVISAKHRQDANSSAVLIEKATITKNYVLPNEQWSYFTHVGPVARIRFSYRFVCRQNYYGSSCSTFCFPRNDSLGHHTCDGQGRIVCLPGWTATHSYCRTAVCRPGCDLVHGSCQIPNECQCEDGWQGPNCTQCRPHPSCVHGTCSNRKWECNCYPGWGGSYCNQDLVSCSRIKPCKNGALCRNKPGSFDCICPKGYTGRLCEIEIDECSSNPCFHGGNCTDLVGDYNCTCPKGYGGKQCFSICSPNTCQNGGKCVNGIRGSFCTCKEGFMGASCEKVLPTSPANNSNTGESSSHSSNHPSSHSSNHSSNHLSSTRESTTNASTAEPTTAFPSKNGTGGTFRERESVETRRTTMIVAIVVSVTTVLILIAASVAWKFWRKRRREATDHTNAGAIEAAHVRNPKQIAIEDTDPKYCAGARSGNPEIIRNFTSSKQQEKNTNKKQEHLGEEKIPKIISSQDNGRKEVELTDISTTTTTTKKKPTRMNLDELYLPNRCYDQGFWQEVDLEI